jgi:hypothetical protein
MQNSSSSVRVNTSGWLFSRFSQQFTGALTVTNTSQSSLNAPVMVVLSSLSPGAGITLQNATGTFNGSPYIVVQSSGTLAPGGSAKVALQFSDPAKTPISFSPATYSS